MANGNSDYQTALIGVTTDKPQKAPDAGQLSRKQARARFKVTLLGNEAAGEYHTLGSLGIAGARVEPEGCRIRFGGAGNINLTAKLVKVDKAGANAADLSATTSAITGVAAAVTLAAPAGADTVALADSDVIRLVFPAVTTTTAGRELLVTVEYDYPGNI